MRVRTRSGIQVLGVDPMLEGQGWVPEAILMRLGFICFRRLVRKIKTLTVVLLKDYNSHAPASKTPLVESRK